MSDLELALRELSPEQRELLLLRLKQAAGEKPSGTLAQILPREGETGPLPLSFAQQRLWFLDRLEPGSPAYNIPNVYRLSGTLDAPVLESALREVVRRHQALRTVFPEVDGRAAQMVVEADLQLPVVDLTGLAEEERRTVTAERAREEARRPFDLARGPLVRAVLLRLAPDEHALLLTMHHIVTDGWSMGVFFRELATLYDAFSRGAPSPLPELEIQYGDYAVWQREHLRGDIVEKQLAYWKERLAGAPAVLDLPPDRPRPPVQSHRGARETLVLPVELLHGIEALARREGVTPFMVLLAAFDLLLYRYSGQDDVVVGTPVAGRTRPELEGLIGFFVNTLVLRTDLSGDPSVRELLRRVRDAALGAFAHQDLPFERLVDELKPDRSLTHSPLFQAMFVLQTGSAERPQLGALKLAPGQYHSGTAQFDLHLSAEILSSGIPVLLNYATDLFEAATIRRMLGHYERLLQGMVADPGRRLSELELLGAEERRRVLGEWSGAGLRFPCRPLVHERVAEQARRRPGASALSHDGAQMSYGALEERSNRLARHLRRLGVGPETRVGLCLERSPEMVVALLAVLKAGGAYVPLDPVYPAERLAYVLEDAAVPVLLTQERLLDALPAHGAAVVCVDRDWAEIERQEAGPLESGVGPENLAYVIYTSGSTGRPKGVGVPHGNVVRLLSATEQWFGFGAEDVWTLFHSYAFDFSVWELWGALAYGGRLVVVPHLVARSPEDLYALLEEEGVTVLNQTPSAFTSLMRVDEEAAAAGRMRDLALRYVIFGGEALAPGTLREWKERRGEERPHLVNMYGITETTVHVTYRPVLRADVEDGVRSVVGEPIGDLRIYLLDRGGEPVPEGVAGEIHVGGAGVARGYLNRAGLTAERFVPDPFGGEPGARLYRSGDLARWLPGGELEYLGRIDNQVKIRGFRIELGEIESVLRGHAEVRECAVLVREDVPGHKRLVAYVVGAEGSEPEVGELGGYLKERLPEHMVPSAFMVLERLPLNANGKLDRTVLPAPDGARPELGTGYEAPRTEVEEALAEVWTEVLRVERVGIHDNFFELGGDSILSIQVIARAARRGIHLSARQLFQHQTVAAQAAVAGATALAQAEQGVLRGAVQLTPIQRWFFAQERAHPHHYNQSFMLEVSGSLRAGVVEEALSRLLAHHDALRLRFHRTDSGWISHYAPLEPLALERIDLAHLDADEAGQRRVLHEAATRVQAGLELEHGPVLRGAWIELGSRGRRLLLVIHHLAVDGVSWRILLEDLEQLCRGATRGEAVRLPPKTTSYRAWAERLLAHAQSEELKRELAYWRGQVEGARGTLPRQGGGGENTVGGSRTHWAALEEEETRALLQEVPQAYRTRIDEALLAALARVLPAWAGVERLRIELEGHGREDLFEEMDLTRTVGWFTSIYPFALEEVEEGVGAQLVWAKERLRSVPQRGIGYGLLRYLSEDAAVREALAGEEAPEVVFNYLGQFDQVLADGDAPFRGVGDPRGAEHAAQERRAYALEINAQVSGGRLRVGWTYGEGLHERSAIEGLAGRYLESLREVIEHCRSEGAGGYTPSDFPEVELSADELDDVLAELGYS